MGDSAIDLNGAQVYAASDAAEAHFVCALLAEAGIEATVVGEPLRGILGDVPFFMAGPRVWVRPSDVDRARAVVADYESRLRQHTVRQAAAPVTNRTGASEAIFCYHCGEPVESGQPTCTACGQTLEWNDSEAKPD